MVNTCATGSRMIVMCRLDPGFGKQFHPAQRQVHIDQRFDALANTTSRSSARHAA